MQSDLNHAVVIPKDMIEQGSSGGLIFISFPSLRTLILAADTIVIDEHIPMAKIFRQTATGPRLIGSFNPTLPWVMLESGLVDIKTHSEFLTKKKGFDDQWETFMKGLYPEETTRPAELPSNKTYL